MANPSSASTPSPKKQAEFDLLNHLLDSRESYPWNVVEADDYMQSVEAAGSALEMTDVEAATGWSALSQTLDQVVGNVSQSSLANALAAKFSRRLSSSIIQVISEAAEQVAASGQPMLDQIVACSKDVLTAWDEADLQVMARPLAYAMRSGQTEEILDVTIQSVQENDWDALNSMEQARVGLAAARYALDYLQANSPE